VARAKQEIAKLKEEKRLGIKTKKALEKSSKKKAQRESELPKEPKPKKLPKKFHLRYFLMDGESTKKRKEKTENDSESESEEMNSESEKENDEDLDEEELHNLMEFGQYKNPEVFDENEEQNESESSLKVLDEDCSPSKIKKAKIKKETKRKGRNENVYFFYKFIRK